jgi:CheY-like chemotaxis protein
MEALLRTTNLLIVDDDEFVRGALTRALNQTGAFTVILAESGEAALGLLARERIDAVLTDLQMPTMDGLTLLGHLFRRGINVPVAVMTGQEIDPELARRLHDHGIAATFTKPVNVGTLADELQRALDPEAVGRIKGITLFGLLQLLEVERKTAQIVVRSAGNEGRLYFDAGKLTHAHARRVTGVEAAYEILGWADPTVEIFDKRRARQHTVTESLQHVLMEAARRTDERGGTVRELPDPLPVPAPSVDTRSELDSSAVQGALNEALGIAGAIGAALVHVPSGMTLGEAGGTPGATLDLAAAVVTDLVRAQLKGMATLKLDDVVEEIIITLGLQYQLICFVGSAHEYFVYVVLDRARANLGMARLQASGIARRLSP